MSTKHYDSDYLDSTANKVAKLKNISFATFLNSKNKTFVDLGCGNGSDLIRVSTQSSNSNTFIGVDHDPKLIQLAKDQSLEKQNINFILGEVSNLPFAENSIDGIRIERVIQHLSQPTDAFSEVFRVLKKDGELVIIETDWQGISFFLDMPYEEMKMTEFLVKKKVNNGLASRKIIDYITQTGFSNPAISIFNYTMKSLKESNMLIMLEKILSEMQEEDFLSNEKISRVKKRLNHLDGINCLRISMNLVMYSAIK